MSISFLFSFRKAENCAFSYASNAIGLLFAFKANFHRNTHQRQVRNSKERTRVIGRFKKMAKSQMEAEVAIPSTPKELAHALLRGGESVQRKKQGADP